MHEGPIYGKRTGKEKENEHMRGRMGESRFRNVLYVLYGFVWVAWVMHVANGW